MVRDHYEDEQKANAYLIAAAPDLLAALIACAIEIAQIQNRKKTSGEVIALDWARDAIAKAEGRT